MATPRTAPSTARIPVSLSTTTPAATSSVSKKGRSIPLPLWFGFTKNAAGTIRTGCCHVHVRAKPRWTVRMVGIVGHLQPMVLLPGPAGSQALPAPHPAPSKPPLSLLELLVVDDPKPLVLVHQIVDFFVPNRHTAPRPLVDPEPPPVVRNRTAADTVDQDPRNARTLVPKSLTLNSYRCSLELPLG